MQHDTTTHNKVVKRYKLSLHNKCCMLLHEKLGSFDRGFKDKPSKLYVLYTAKAIYIPRNFNSCRYETVTESFLKISFYIGPLT